MKLCDIAKQDAPLKLEILKKIASVMDTSSFIMGKEVELFEQNFSVYCNSGYAIACANGTDAIEIALRALGVGPGDEVITVPFTFAATIEAVMAVGARPVFADVQKSTLLMDPKRLEAKITRKTKAVIPVHLYGQPCDIDEILEIANAGKLKVVFDCAQAHGAKYKSRSVSEYGDFCTFSFFPGKNLGAYGDAGALTTSNSELADKARMIADHGRAQGRKYEHNMVGINSRMDTIQAGILNIKLRSLESWIENRRKIAAVYHQRLCLDYGFNCLGQVADRRHVYHLYVLRLRKRNDMYDYLWKNDIEVGIHYPIPLHLQSGYKSLGYSRGDFPVSEQAAEEVLSLPIHGVLTEEEAIRVADLIRAFFD